MKKEFKSYEYNSFTSVNVIPYDSIDKLEFTQSAYLVLVKDGQAITKFTNATEIDYNAARQAIGFSDDGVIIVTVDKPGMKFEELAKVFVNYNAKYAINLDGGGSVRKMIDGTVVNTPTEDRKVDNVFCVYLKDVIDGPFSIIWGMGEWTTVEPVIGYAGIDTDLAEMFTIPAGETIEVATVINNWGVIQYEYQHGFIQYTGTNLVPKGDVIEKPTEDPVDDKSNESDIDSEFVPGVYHVTLSVGINIRKLPINGATIGGYEYNDEVIVTELVENGAWGVVAYDTQVGYVCMKYLERVRDYEPPVPEPDEEQDILDNFQDKDLVAP